MKKLLIVLFAFSYSFVNAQKDSNAELTFTESKVNSLKFSVDSSEELNSINWKDIKDVFLENKDQDSISLAFELKKNAKRNLYYKFSIKGTSNNIDNLINRSKKIINVLHKLNSKK